MKITVITSPFLELPPIAIGAVEKLFYQLAGEWVKAGNAVSFICSGGGDDERMGFVRLKKYNRTGSTKKDLIWDFLYSVKALWKCPKTDILLCNTFWAPALAPLFWWKYKRLVYGVHRYPKGQYWLYPFVHTFICVSTAVADELKRQLGEVKNRERVLRIVNPIDESIFNTSLPRCPKIGRVLYAGRIHPAKGLVCLAKACKRLGEDGVCSELVLVGVYDKTQGGGGDKFVSELRSVAAPCTVTVAGAILNPRELASIERSASVFVYPSEDSLGEACPIGPMEAMALGVPTIVSGLECYDDYVLDGINAFKFKTNDHDDLGRKISHLMLNHQLCNEISSQCSRIAGEYSRQVVATRYLNCFWRLLNGR